MKTAECDQTWRPIFDAQLTASIGCIAYAPSKQDIICVGSGEVRRSPISPQAQPLQRNLP